MIKKRLEKVVVGPIQQCHLEAVVVGKLLCALQPGEASSNDQDFAGDGITINHGKTLPCLNSKGNMSL